jgi:hypothetical protein
MMAVVAMGDCRHEPTGYHRQSREWLLSRIHAVFRGL